MNKRYSISVILPAYNEKGNIEKLIEETSDFLSIQDTLDSYEIIVVDDGSRDNTAEIIRGLVSKNIYLKLISHCKNLGYGKALMSGVKNAQYPLILFMDADGQFKIDNLNEMLNYILIYDIIVGYRYKRKDPLYRIGLGKIYTLLSCFFLGLNFKDINCGFKLFKRETIDHDYKFVRGLFYTEVLLKAKNKDFRIKEIPVRHFPRLRGKQSGASLKVIFTTIIDLGRLAFFLAKDKIKNL